MKKVLGYILLVFVLVILFITAIQFMGTSVSTVHGCGGKGERECGYWDKRINKYMHKWFG